jgi:hypothetical protein
MSSVVSTVLREVDNAQAVYYDEKVQAIQNERLAKEGAIIAKKSVYDQIPIGADTDARRRDMDADIAADVQHLRYLREKELHWLRIRASAWNRIIPSEEVPTFNIIIGFLLLSPNHSQAINFVKAVLSTPMKKKKKDSPKKTKKPLSSDTFIFSFKEKSE